MPGERRLSPIHKRKNNKWRIKKEIDKEESITTPKLLPSELWGKILEHLYLDEILSCMDINRFIRHHVSASIHTLFIKRSSANLLRLPPTSHLKRFSNVKRVYIYSLISEIGENNGELVVELMESIADQENEPMSISEAFMLAVRRLNSEGPPKFHLDHTTLEHALPFLLQFPRLNYVFLGGLSNCEEDEGSGVELGYSTDTRYDLEDSTTRFARLIQAVGDAYVNSSLKPNVEIGCIVTEQQCQYTGKPCAWRNVVTIPGYQTDVACQMCDFICQTFPVDQVCHFMDAEIPCITSVDRLNIALSRDSAAVRFKSTDMLLESLSDARSTPVMLPPEFKKYGLATHFFDEMLEVMNWMIKNGANLADVRLRHELVKKSEVEKLEWDDAREKRIMGLEIFEKLKRLGFEIYKSDFTLVDMGDSRSIPSSDQFPCSDDDTESDHD